MRPTFHHAALLFGFAGLCLAAALALELGRVSGRAGTEVGATGRGLNADAGEITGRIAAAPSVRLPLSDEQRGRIFDDIMKLTDAPVADVPAPDAAIVMPSSVALQELPESATRDVPQIAGYKFVKLEDRILLVSPANRGVVAEMPRYHTVLD